MRVQRIILGLAAGMLCMPSAASAILIETGGVRVGGYFVRDDGKTLTIRVRAADGNEKDADYERSKIKIIHQIDRGRLEKLGKGNPKAYRDHAEELTAHKADPEARDAAMRLFLIAAYLDPQQLGPAALLRMSSLAHTPGEARRCRAMAFLLDPKADDSMLRMEAAKKPRPGKTETSALQDFLKALQLYRAGQLKFIKGAAGREGLDKIFGMAPGMTSQDAFLKKCRDAYCSTCNPKGGFSGKTICAECKGTGTTVSPFGQSQFCTKCKGLRFATCATCDGTCVNQGIIDEALPVILRAELWGLDQLYGVDAGGKRGGDSKWSALLQSRQVSPVGTLSLETITEFDPRKYLYRGGVWAAP